MILSLLTLLPIAVFGSPIDVYNIQTPREYNGSCKLHYGDDRVALECTLSTSPNLPRKCMEAIIDSDRENALFILHPAISWKSLLDVCPPFESVLGQIEAIAHERGINLLEAEESDASIAYGVAYLYLTGPLFNAMFGGHVKSDYSSLFGFVFSS